MTAIEGRRLWGELHEFARGSKLRHDQLTFFPRWLAEVEQTLGCVSCFWKVERFCKLWPVAYGEEFELWATCLHDYVNKEMGRNLVYPDLTLAPLKAKGIIQ